MAASIWISTSASISNGRLHERHFGHARDDGPDEHPITAFRCSLGVVSDMVNANRQRHAQSERHDGNLALFASLWNSRVSSEHAEPVGTIGPFRGCRGRKAGGLRACGRAHGGLAVVVTGQLDLFICLRTEGQQSVSRQDLAHAVLQAMEFLACILRERRKTLPIARCR